MIRLVQLGIDHPHAAAYRGMLWALRDRIEVVGFLARPEDPTTPVAGPFVEVPVFRSLDELSAATRPDAAQVMLRNNEMGRGVQSTKFKVRRGKHANFDP